MKKILGIALLCAVAGSAMAVPARPGGMVRTDAEGTEKTVFLNGDETFHYLTDAEGNWLDEETLRPLTEEMKNEKLKMKGESGRAKARRAQQTTGLDRLLASRGAVILVNFADKEFKSTNAGMTEWAMGDNYTYNGATGSIRQYFRDQSWGDFNLEIDVVGPVNVSHNYSYYGKNDSWGNDMRADELVVEACRLAHDSLGLDFSGYDSNNDGDVDWVVILYAGKGEADGGAANTVWPHQYELHYTNKEFKLDGKWVDHYCCLNELDGTTGTRNGIGTFCHEFSHVMGLPDFYATNGEEHHTLLSWDIMDYGAYLNGGNTPPSYSAYERWFMGWFRPRLINTDCKVILPELNEYHSACVMTEEGNDVDFILNPSPSVFYLFENRQKAGWDKYLPGSGMIITRISYSAYRWSNNMVNNNANNMGVDIIEATPNTSSGLNARSKATDAYPRGATEFTDITRFQVTDIAMEDQVVTFKVNNGRKTINLKLDDVKGDEVQSTKMLEEGRVVIIREGIKYDILGKRL